MNRSGNIRSLIVFLIVTGLVVIACQSVTGITEDLGMGGDGFDASPAGEVDTSSMYALLRAYAEERGWPENIATECDAGVSIMQPAGEPCFYQLQNEFRDGYGLGISYYLEDQKVDSKCYKGSSVEVYYTREEMDLTHLLNEGFTTTEHQGVTIYVWDSSSPNLTNLYQRWMIGPVYFQTVEGSYGPGCENQLVTSQPYEIIFYLVGQGYLEQ